jgi:small subunit ribosomal protein S20
MPITSSAKKKMRGDLRKRAHNLVYKLAVKKAVKTARKERSAATMQAAQKILDKAVRARLIHKNKAARLKSRLVRHAKKAA